MHEVDAYLFIGMLLVNWLGHHRMALDGRLVVEFTSQQVFLDEMCMQLTLLDDFHPFEYYKIVVD